MIIIARIKLPRLNREACSNNLSREPGEGEDRKVLMNFWAHFNFPSRGMHFFCLPVDLGTEIGCYGTNLGIFLLLVLIGQVRIFHLAFSTLSLEKGLPSFLSSKQQWSLLRRCGGGEVGPSPRTPARGPGAPRSQAGAWGPAGLAVVTTGARGGGCPGSRLSLGLSRT